MMPSSTNRRGLVLRYKNGIAISMDGKGPWRDNNVSVERLCAASNTVRAYDSVSVARTSQSGSSTAVSSAFLVAEKMDFFSPRPLVALRFQFPTLV